MNSHPVRDRFTFKDFIYKLNLYQIIGLFLLSFLIFSFIFFIIYSIILSGENKSFFEILKFSVYQSFGFDIDFNSNIYNFEYISFSQQFISLVLNLIFTSALVLKYFTKPNFFEFKKKVNIFNNYLVISLYNKTSFEINSCKFTVYLRLPYKDSNGINSLNNIQLFPDRDFFPFMDKHLVTRLRINLNDEKNKLAKDGTDFHDGILKILNTTNCSDNIQNLRISILIDAITPQIDSSIYETYTYEVNICDQKSINNYITYKEPNSIDIDMVDFSKSKGWENFED